MARVDNAQSGLRVRDATWFYGLIDSFYNSNPQPEILRQPINQPVKLGMLVDEFN
jgi:hypothetical protein